MISNFIKRSSSSTNLDGQYSQNSTGVNTNYNTVNSTFFTSYINAKNYSNADTNKTYDTTSNAAANSLSNNDVIVTEEVHDNCVYQVTIKKIYNNKNFDSTNKTVNNNPYGSYKPLTNAFFNTPSTPPVQNKSDGLVYTRVKIKQLKYASLEKFVECLINEQTGELDLNLTETFLATYRSFTDTPTVIRMLRWRYEQIMPAQLDMTEDVRIECLKSLRRIIKMWLNNYIEDFNGCCTNNNLTTTSSIGDDSSYSSTSSSSNTNCQNLKELKKFINELLNDDLDLINLFNSKFDSNESLVVVSTTNNYYSMEHNSSLSLSANNQHNTNKLKLNSISTSNSVNNLNTFSSLKNSIENLLLTLTEDFMSIDSIYFAEQLTYIDKCLFQSIYAHHCLGSVWSTRYQKMSKNGANNANTTSLFISSVNNQSTSSISKLVESTNSNTAVMTNSLTMPVLSDKFASIRAFIDQFNCVSFVVQAKVLEKTDLRPLERAKIICKWIEIAWACKKFKNFSSLNAIVQGLNTQCVSRLTKTWNEVPVEIKNRFNELTEMFSQDQNQKTFRDILRKNLKQYKTLFDSNAKQPDFKRDNFLKSSISSDSKPNNKYDDINYGINATLSKKMKEKLVVASKTHSHSASMSSAPLSNKNYFKDLSGFVPFLGTFLKDLEYVNAQNPIKNDKGLINVAKKRKEYEIIAQIKLLQQASQLYNIKADPNFNVWLHKQPIYSEAQYYEFSYLIEPKFDALNSQNSNYSGNANQQHRKSKLSISQHSHSNSIDSINSYNRLAPSKQYTNQIKYDHSRNSSLGSSDLLENLAITKVNNQSKQLSHDTNSNDSNEENVSTKLSINNMSTSTSSEIRVKVKIEADHNNNSKNSSNMIASTVVYKQLSISDKFRTKDVKRLILQKFFLNPDLCDQYVLVQVFNNNNNSMMTSNYQTQYSNDSSTSNYSAFSNQSHQNELIINDNQNVIYAAKKVNDMQFLLRPKTMTKPPSAPQSSYTNSSMNSKSNGKLNYEYARNTPLQNSKSQQYYSSSGNLAYHNKMSGSASYGTTTKHKNWNLFKNWL